MPKAKTSTSPSDLTLYTDLSREALLALFNELAEGINRQCDAGTVEERAAAEQDTLVAVKAALTAGEHAEIVQRRDHLVELLLAIEEKETSVRRRVQLAETYARRLKKFREYLEGGIFLAMLNDNIQVIEGELHRFKLYRAPNKLEITDEAAIPEEYRTPTVRDVLATAIGFILKRLDHGEPIEQLLIDQARAALKAHQELPEDSTLNKDKLKEDLEAGKTVPGCYLETDRKTLNVK